MFRLVFVGKCSITGGVDIKHVVGWGLKEKPKGRSYGVMLDSTLKERVLKLRKRYEWGPNKIVGYLVYRGITVNHHQVYDVICQAGLNRLITEP